jgi:hypothetical protein
LDGAERLQQTRQLGHGKKSQRLTRKRKRSSTPMEELSSDRENVFLDAEKEVEERTSDDDRDFRGGVGEGINTLEIRRSKRILEGLD